MYRKVLIVATKVIKKDISLTDIEETLRNIREYERIRLPNSFRLGGLGIESALSQLIITWARAQKDMGELHTYLSDIGDLNTEKFLKNMAGMTAAVMAPKITKVKHEQVERKEFLKGGVNIIDAMYQGRFSELHIGSSLLLSSISGADKRWLRCVFDEPRKVKKPTEMKGTVRDILSTIVPASGDKQRLSDIVTEGFIESIAWMVYELFQNTVDHAETDENGKSYFRTIGALRFNIQKVDQSDLVRIHHEFESLEANGLRIFELSVMDSGPGFARKWTGKGFDDLSIEEEKKAIRECFEKYKSTKKKDGRGVGLDNVLENLRQHNGFFRMRTGRLEVIKSYLSTYRVHNTINNMHEKAPVEGTLMSLFIPLRKGEKNG